MLLQESLGANYEVHLAMRYKNPSIPDVLEAMRKRNYATIVVLPMFPQYASASTGSAIEEMMDVIKAWWVIPQLKIINQYYDHPLFIDAFVARARQYDMASYDHVLFSYHGLPKRQVDKVHLSGKCEDDHCLHEIDDDNRFCYRGTCYATTRLLAGKLGITPDRYTVCFQSRLDDKWLQPFSDQVVEECGKKGMKKLLVFSPAFTADCLETVIEIGDEYQHLFRENGGEQIQLVESLNDHPIWIKCLEDLVRTA